MLRRIWVSQGRTNRAGGVVHHGDMTELGEGPVSKLYGFMTLMLDKGEDFLLIPGSNKSLRNISVQPLNFSTFLPI